MVEAVAKAIYEKRNGAGATPWAWRDAAHRAPYIADARAAIMAIKESMPTDAMIEAGLEAFRDAGLIAIDRDPIFVLRGMMHAALDNQET